MSPTTTYVACSLSYAGATCGTLLGMLAAVAVAVRMGAIALCAAVLDGANFVGVCVDLSSLGAFKLPCGTAVVRTCNDWTESGVWLMLTGAHWQVVHEHHLSRWRAKAHTDAQEAVEILALSMMPDFGERTERPPPASGGREGARRSCDAAATQTLEQQHASR
eukprot:gene7243-9072_t